ncbi:hypothetical protein D2A34_14470 [Clostridium chromiireducens]|uniref:Uncharacterized protein n=1 Tax=Clostridium chromiireducens TaxID=225345 RepID=A0A399IMW2_9CLOT|nr:hypothetical protein [Clostridium chromiireducens]RII34345.1 hypothetical protein D2A34_14470 [Clostridium chromiireducens]
MDDKKIDDMFFKLYGYDLLPNEYKEIARETSAYAGFRLYIKMQEIFKNKIRWILGALTK